MQDCFSYSRITSGGSSPVRMEKPQTVFGMTDVHASASKCVDDQLCLGRVARHRDAARSSILIDACGKNDKVDMVAMSYGTAQGFHDDCSNNFATGVAICR